MVQDVRTHIIQIGTETTPLVTLNLIHPLALRFITQVNLAATILPQPNTIPWVQSSSLYIPLWHLQLIAQTVDYDVDYQLGLLFDEILKLYLPTASHFILSDTSINVIIVSDLI